MTLARGTAGKTSLGHVRWGAVVTGRPLVAADRMVGRDTVTNEMSSAVQAAVAGRGSLVVVTGEAGIGKTTVAEWVAADAASRGMLVRWGTCWPDDGTPPLFAWSQLIEAHLAGLDNDALRAAAGREPWAIAAVAPSLSARLGVVDDRPVVDPVAARFELLRAVDRFWESATAGGTTPLLLIIEDIHWADRGTLLLVSQMATMLARRAMCVVVTLRSGEVVPDEQIAQGLIDMTGRAGLVIPLDGLSSADVGILLDRAGIRSDSAMLDALMARTAGNPFFVTELLRVLRLTGASTDTTHRVAINEVPRQVADVVARRIARLPAAVARLLQTASVLGPESTVAFLADTAELDVSDATTLLDHAVSAGLMSRVDGSRWRFSHALVRDAVYGSLPAANRRQLHARALDVLERSNPQPSAGELARHAIEAQPLSTPARVSMLAARAGRVAMAQLGYESAAAHFGDALRALDSVAVADPSERAGLLLELGHAHRCAGSTEQARDAFLAAADISDDQTTIAVAAAGFASPGADLGIAYHVEDPRAVALFERALAALPDSDSRDRVVLQARLGAELYFSDDPARSRSLVDSAVAMARRLGDPNALVTALAAHHDSFVVGQVPTADALSGSEALLQLARRTGAPRQMLTAHRARVFDLIAAGDLVAVDAEIAAFRMIADELRMPAYQWWWQLWRAMRLLLEGRHREAESEALTAFQTGTPSSPTLSFLNLSFLLFFLRREQGRLNELEGPMRQTAMDRADIPAFVPALAMLLAELGHFDEAAAAVGRVSDDGYSRVIDRNWPVSWFQLARAVSLAGDVTKARDLFRLGLPLAGQCVMVSLGTVCLGAADLGLAWLAETVGDVDAADDWYQRAEATNARLGAKSWLAQTRADHARLLGHLDTDDARERAGTLAQLALDAATDIGMPGVIAVANAVLTAAPRVLPRASTAEGVFRRDGSVWELTFADSTVRLPHAKGLVDIAHLMARPAQSIHVADLLAAQADGFRTTAGSSTQVLDDRAKREIRSRIADLEQDADEAEAMNDIERAERIRAERDFLLREIAAALGLGGKDRRLDDVAERARKTVTARIHNSIERVRRAHPALGRHLDRSIDTGLWCVYRPETPVEWRL